MFLGPSEVGPGVEAGGAVVDCGGDWLEDAEVAWTGWDGCSPLHPKITDSAKQMKSTDRMLVNPTNSLAMTAPFLLNDRRKA
jgi:hypothetical protein